ncbi:complement C1q tumor necrosis factor-related protein 3-like [Denticeps clupeoides]|uniref:C1q domain-containing protein n=1 Tax=Denticeps clupeoides TaxID=299321 RepID=A0AAY4DRX8_9TELE|nr:complement C1q tumor necrosis factor-related protein 3-like [Denticeps clupeoides]
MGVTVIVAVASLLGCLTGPVALEGSSGGQVEAGGNEMCCVPAVIVSRLYALEEKLVAAEKKLAELKKTKESVKVAFTVSLQGETLGPYTTPTTLIYKTVHTNIGSAYSPLTGIFTAPTKGLYYFSFTCFKRSPYISHASLVKNDADVVRVYDHTTSDPDSMATNSAAVQLEAGDVVFVRLVASTQIVGKSDLTTFSGFLVYPL